MIDKREIYTRFFICQVRFRFFLKNPALYPRFFSISRLSIDSMDNAQRSRFELRGQRLGGNPFTPEFHLPSFYEKPLPGGELKIVTGRRHRTHQQHDTWDGTSFLLDSRL